MLATVVKNFNLQNMGALTKLVRCQQRVGGAALMAAAQQQQPARCISKSTENEMNVDYLTFREQVSPLMKDKKYNMKRASR